MLRAEGEYSVEKPITLKFKYTEKEYVEAVKWYYSKLSNVKLDVIISIVLIVLSGSLWVTGGKETYFAGIFLLGCIMLLIIIFALYINPKRNFKQELKFHDEYNLSITDEGISFQTVNISSMIAWNHYSKVKENNNFFYLIYGKYMFTIIPKRTFINKNEEELFRKLVEEKLDIK